MREGRLVVLRGAPQVVPSNFCSSKKERKKEKNSLGDYDVKLVLIGDGENESEDDEKVGESPEEHATAEHSSTRCLTMKHLQDE